MPYLRFVRNKRGYENTFVMHAARRLGTGRQRILYWFRTPPGVRVGRAALDEDAIRAIEEGNPDWMFDWPKMLKVSRAPLVADRGEDKKPRRGRRERRRPAQATPPSAGRPAGLEFEAPDEAVPESPRGTVAEPAASARMAAEDLARLGARYAEIMARIAERVSDPARRETLRAEAETLNPDTWVTSDEVAQGVAEFEKRYEELRSKLGRRRRSRRGGRRRRRGRRGSREPVAAPAVAQPGVSEAPAPDSQEPDEQEPKEEV